MKLVTLEQVKAHLRIDTEDGDADLSLKVEAASSLVVDYLKDFEYAAFDSAGVILDSTGDPVDVLPKVQAATLLLVGFLHRERDGSNEYAVPSAWGYGYLPHGVVSLLYNLRPPTVI